MATAGLNLGEVRDDERYSQTEQERVDVQERNAEAKQDTVREKHLVRLVLLGQRHHHEREHGDDHARRNQVLCNRWFNLCCEATKSEKGDLCSVGIEDSSGESTDGVQEENLQGSDKGDGGRRGDVPETAFSGCRSGGGGSQESACPRH